MTIRLNDAVKGRLDKLADSTQRSRSFQAAEAIRDYVLAHEWPVAEIQVALIEADADQFASDADVAALAAVGMLAGQPGLGRPAPVSGWCSRPATACTIGCAVTA